MERGGLLGFLLAAVNKCPLDLARYTYLLIFHYFLVMLIVRNHSYQDLGFSLTFWIKLVNKII
jgi:hypothetical protein